MTLEHTTETTHNIEDIAFGDETDELNYDDILREARLYDPFPHKILFAIVETVWSEIPDHDFTEWAQCKGADLRYFFDEPPEDSNLPDSVKDAIATAWTGVVSPEAAALCSACPVKHLCAEEVLKHPTHYVYGTMAGVRIPQSVKNSRPTLTRLREESIKVEEAKNQVRMQVLITGTALRRTGGDVAAAWALLETHVSRRVFVRTCYLIANRVPSFNIHP